MIKLIIIIIFILVSIPAGNLRGQEPPPSEAQIKAPENPVEAESENSPPEQKVTVTAPENNPSDGSVDSSNSDPQQTPAPDLLPEVDQTNLPLPNWEKPSQYWQRYYHPQVTPRVFLVLNYPYYPGGRSYALNQSQPENAAIKKEENPPSIDSTATGEKSSPDKTSPVSEAPAPAPEPSAFEAQPDQKTESPAPNPDNQTEPKPTDSAPADSSAPSQKAESEKQNSPVENKPTPSTEEDESATTYRLRYHFTKISDMIYQWRQINESEGTTLEIVRSLELTKTTSQIYQTDAKLAIDVKRTIGQIATINGRFDVTSHKALEQTLNGQDDGALLARLEQQLADLKSLLEHLAEQNDRIGTALGLGAFGRTGSATFSHDKIDFSNLVLSSSCPVREIKQ